MRCQTRWWSPTGWARRGSGPGSPLPGLKADIADARAPGACWSAAPHVGWRFTSSVCIGYPSNGLCAWMSAIRPHDGPTSDCHSQAQGISMARIATGCASQTFPLRSPALTHRITASPGCIIMSVCRKKSCWLRSVAVHIPLHGVRRTYVSGCDALQGDIYLEYAKPALSYTVRMSC